MWASMAIASRSRKRRDSRSLTIRMYHVAVADTATPMAAVTITVRSPSSTPSVNIFNHRANRASGSIISSVVPRDPSSRRGSAR